MCVSALAFLLVFGSLAQRSFRKSRRFAQNEERKRIDNALAQQRITRQQNEALTEEIRERRKIEIELRHTAFHDALTGLGNRAFLHDAIATLLSKPSVPGQHHPELFFLDLDSFKVINDTFGHRMGDLFLIEIAQRLRAFAGVAGLVARAGGDQFAVILHPPCDAARAAQRLLNLIEQPITLAGMAVPLTASLGLCQIVSGYREPEEVLRDADIAMFSAKRSGGARHAVYDPALQVNALAALQSKLQLKAAVANQEFVLFYQPLIDMRDRSIRGMEALIRWNHPTRGLLAPGAFIQLAEETGHIVAMGNWVLEQACKDLQQLQSASSRKLLMSLNVCGKQLDLPNYFDLFTSALRTHDTDPTSIQLEITESIFIKDAVRIGQLFKQIRSLGVQIAFDDFGTGYSSLSYLERYPIDTLKIDQSFVQHMGHGSVNAQIVELVINMAEAIGMKTSAEGVEEELQAQTLLRYGCTLAQGYLYSKPVTIERMLALLHAQEDQIHPCQPLTLVPKAVPVCA